MAGTKKVYQVQMTDWELDYLIKTLRLDLDAGSVEPCQTILENLEQVKKDGLIIDFTRR
jgi:hypothetical protein